MDTDFLSMNPLLPEIPPYISQNTATSWNTIQGHSGVKNECYIQEREKLLGKSG